MIRILITVFSLVIVKCDIYLHNPRGSNNRLNGGSRGVDNQHRLFNSQNNQKGGYNVGTGSMYYYAGSKLQIEWTHQNSCDSDNTNCDIIIQYMCSPNLRDGTVLETVTDNLAVKDTARFGMHEDFEYYLGCYLRHQNRNIFQADQNIKTKTARHTRQNPKGDRYGFECPEERDYYPYFQPTPWIDIAVLTNNPERCDYFRRESENVKSRWYCNIPNMKEYLFNANGDNWLPINKSACEKFSFKDKKGVWTEIKKEKLAPPICELNKYTRDNHLGDTTGTFSTSTFNWTVPDIEEKNCALRIRYNISTNDVNENVDALSNTNQTRIGIYKSVNMKLEDAVNRGYVYKNNPEVKMFADLNFKLKLAINTAQHGRVFQDRSHKFSILKRPSNINPNAVIHNLNVRGKRGNIVQVYPSVEYDFVPTKLEASNNQYIHFQWTGSDNNPGNNDGQGKARTDRNNIVVLNERSFNNYSKKSIGDYGVNYPMKIQDMKNPLFDFETLRSLAFLKKGNTQYGGTLDDASAYFDLAPVQLKKEGVMHYMSTRNNAFTNRDQKGIIIVSNGVSNSPGTFAYISDSINIKTGYTLTVLAAVLAAILVTIATVYFFKYNRRNYTRLS